MIRNYKKMHGTHIQALDGEIGHLKDVYFNDSSWEIQYFVIELGSWFSGKDILMPPDAVSLIDGISSLKVELTKAELQLCPHADSAIPVSLQQRYRERSLFNLASIAGNLINGGPLIVPPFSEHAADTTEVDPHLRSCRRVSDYTLVARDGEIGSLRDMLIDDQAWLIRFIVAQVNGPDGPQQKFFSPQMIEDIEWSLSTVKIWISKNQLASQPGFDPERHLDVPYEAIAKDL